LELELNISVKENHKTLSAIESINKDLLLSVIIKYLSEIRKSEQELKFFTPFLIDRLEKLLTNIVNNSGSFTTEKLLIISRVFADISISDIFELLKITKLKINNIPNYITKENIDDASSKFIDDYFINYNNDEFELNDEVKEYIKDIIIDQNFKTERQILSDIYWIYNIIKVGDTVRKVTKKGETVGLVKERNNKQFIEADGKEFALTSAWNKLSTRFNFTDIASDIFKISSRLHFVFNLLKAGPIKAEIIKINNTASILLTFNPLNDLPLKQLTFSGTENGKSIISFYNLNIDFEMKTFSHEDDILDSLICEKVLDSINKIVKTEKF
jgi:hypothetical protein